MTLWSQIRNARRNVVSSMALVCFLIPAGHAQSSASDAAAEKPALKSSTTHRKSTKKASSKPSASSAASKSTPKAKTASPGKRSSHKKATRVRGQQKIDSERAEAIQTALIREHYLSGAPTGKWNEESEAAMRRYQADHGWQTKEVPDSRALIKLGLGPSKDHLLNPESAMTTSPDAPKSASLPTTSHSAPATANPALPAVPAQSSSPNQP